MGRYLALDQIAPGDIILSSARTLPSAGIRLATFSRVSHAALALHSLIWFEALGNTGVAYQVVEPEPVWDGSTIRLGMRVPPGERYFVKRLVEPPFRPGDSFARHRFAQSLIQATSQYAFLNYAAPDKFLPMLRFKLGDRRFLQFLAQTLDRRGTRLYPGPFCSWLVASCYQDVDLTVFDKEPQKMSPGAIDRSANLELIAADIEARPIDLPLRFQAFSRDLRSAFVLSRNNLYAISRGAALAKTVAEVNSRFKGFGKRAAELLESGELADMTDDLVSIDKRSDREFDDWRQRAQDALDAAYGQLVFTSESADALAPCWSECLEDSPSCRTSVTGCVRVTRRALEIGESLYEVFPNPIDMLRQQRAERESQPPS